MGTLAERINLIRNCTTCALSTSRTCAVPGAGNAKSKILIIGEAPGYYEDIKGLPFVGKSGSYLDRLLATINLTRANLFICNTLCCRPPNNRDPMPKELAACRPHLEDQIRIVNPKLILTMGRYSSGVFFPHTRISDLHGTVRRMQYLDEYRLVFPMFHPAAAMHNPATKEKIEEDFRVLGNLISKLRLTGYL